MSVVGIDLGTTNTVVACVRDGRVHVLADDKGNRLLPSVVSFHPNGDVLVGPAARERRLVDAKNTISSIKRLIGRPWDSDEIRLARSRFAFELREGPGQGALVIARGEAYTLPEISAFVLKRVRQIAEAALGETVDKAVITVPAHFNELQRASTKVAGRVAGLEVLRILNEPTAAALAYGFGSERSERVAVYDFGGGTFDCSLLDLTGSLFEVLATAGDTFLGGDDIDTAIAEVMCNAFLAQHRYDPRVDPQAFERLKAAAEDLKKDLSVNMQAQVDLPEVAYGVGGKKLGFTFGLTQADLEALSVPFVDRTLQVTQDALNIAHLSPSSFDSVVLVGGSTRMPMVARRVEAFFGVQVIDRVNPDEVVAVGAAVQAAALVDATRKRSIPNAPKPGIIGPPQRVLDDDSPTSAQPSPISARGTGVRPDGMGRAAQPAPNAAPVKTLRPGMSGPSQQQPPPPAPMAAGPMSQDFRTLARSSDEPSLATQSPFQGEADTDDHSIGTGHTMPAAHGQGPPSMTNILDAFQFGNRTGQNAVATGATGATGANATGHEPSTLASAKAPAKPSVAPGSARQAAAWAEMNPLETEDISRIAPDGFARAQAYGRVAPSSPPSAPGSNSLSPRGVDVGPLHTEDISLIVPEPMNPGGRARGPAPFAFPQTPLHAPPPPLPPPPLPARAAGPRNPPPQPQPPPAPFAPPPFEFPAPGGTQQSPLPPLAPLGGPPQPEQSAPRQPFAPFARFGDPPPAQAAPPQPFAPFGANPPQQSAAQPQPFAFPAPQMRNALPAPLPTDFSPPPGWENAAPPVLVDVTPRALVVETVGGYCDTVIPRNAKIPCEHTRVFATGRDLQTVVHVRVGQGEDQKFDANQYLGELELSNLRPATRGEVTLSVTFELDANGTLQVRAIDSTTGRQAQANMKLIAVAQSEEAIEEMIERSRSVSVTG